jgi:hypothetical protein
MNINGNYNIWDVFRSGFGYINTVQKQRAVTTTRDRLPVSEDRNQAIHTMRQAVRMHNALQEIRPIMLEPDEIEVASSARATSVTNLDFDTTGTYTTMQSTEEVNATPTSFSPFGPEWTGSSSAPATISGEYDGSNGTDTLTFEASKEGTHGAQNLTIRVYDSNTVEIDKIDINKGDAINQQYTLSNGLVLTLGEGDLSGNDTFTLEVFDTVGSAVGPDNPFNGIRNDNPNLENGISVTSGSFQINGVTIDVMDDDTINTVLDQINQSNAGVTATFDSDAEQVVLTQTTVGPTQDIVLQNDTSGFLAAVKLDAAAATPGEEPETQKPLAEVVRFSSVQSGSIDVNDAALTIDVNTDSMTDILNRITASGAEVTASFDSTSQRVSLISTDPDNPLVIDSSSTNFFSALGISDGTYNAENVSLEVPGVSVADIYSHLVGSVLAEYADRGDQTLRATQGDTADAGMLGTLVSIIADSMNALFDDSALRSSPGAMLEGIRNDIRSAVSATFDAEGPRFDTDFGIHFDFENPNTGLPAFRRLISVNWRPP